MRHWAVWVFGKATASRVCGDGWRVAIRGPEASKGWEGRTVSVAELVVRAQGGDAEAYTELELGGPGGVVPWGGSERTRPQGATTARNPKKSKRASGSYQFRLAPRQRVESKLRLPPRMMRSCESSVVHSGFFSRAAGEP